MSLTSVFAHKTGGQVGECSRWNVIWSGDVGAAGGRQTSRTETCTTDCYIKYNDIIQVLQAEADIQLLNELLKWM